MSQRDLDNSATRTAKWPILVGPLLGVLCADLSRRFAPGLDTPTREWIAVSLGIVVAIALTYGIHRFVCRIGS
jgi:hypothetical protein